MRTLAAAFDTEMRDSTLDPRYRIVLSLSGQSTVTYDEDRVVSIRHVEEPYHQQAEVVLNNSDLAITTDFEGYQGIVSYGMLVSAVAAYSPTAPLFVVGQQHHSSRGELLTILTCKGIPDLLAEDRAAEPYTQESGDTRTLKTLITAILNATLPPFLHCVNYTATFDTEDALIDTFIPADAFNFGLNTTRLEAIKQLLFYAQMVMRAEDDGAVHFRQPVTSGATYDEEYRVAVADQMELWAKSTRTRIIFPNFIVVQSHPDSVDSFYGAAEDTASSDIANMEKRDHHYLRVTSDTQAGNIATAILETKQLDAQRGSARVPLNVAQEVHDFVLLTDSRQSDTRDGNIAHILRVVESGKWEMMFSFGDAKAGGFLGLFPRPRETTRELVDITGAGQAAGALAQVIGYIDTVLGSLLDQLNMQLETIFSLFSATSQDIRTLAAATSALSLKEDSLQVEERLQIPVGTDKFSITGGASQGNIGPIIELRTISDFIVGFDFIHVTEDIFAIVFADATNNANGTLQTVQISTGGDIGTVPIATFNFESTNNCRNPRIIHVSGTTYLIVYGSSTSPENIVAATVTINKDGTIGGAVIDTLVLDTAEVGAAFTTGNIINISGDTYAVTYNEFHGMGVEDEGYVTTFDVDSAGNIAAAIEDTLQFKADSAENTWIVNVSGTMYAISYTNPNDPANADELRVSTVDIQNNGQIAAAVTDSAVIDAVTFSNGKVRPLIKVGGTVYAIAHRGAGADGFLTTFSISDAGTIGAVIASFEFDINSVRGCHLIPLIGDTYGITYEDRVDFEHMFIAIKISLNGSIGTVLGSLVLETSTNGPPHPVLIPNSDGVLAIVHTTTLSRWRINTVRVELLLDGAMWIEGDELHWFDESGVEQTSFGAIQRTFLADAFQYPNPGTDWTPQVEGAGLGASLTSKTLWLPLNFLKIGDVIVSYKIVGDIVEAAAVTLDCKLVRVNKADPLTTTDISGGGITQLTADGNFDSEATLTNLETVATDRQYVLELTGTTGASDAITVIGVEVLVDRL